MRIVTGAAGFIGSRVICALRKQYPKDAILAVDRLPVDSVRLGYLRNAGPITWVDCDEFMGRLRADALPETHVRAVIHMGAISSTREQNKELLWRYNTLYSQHLFRWAAGRGIPFVYASSGATYGNGALGFDDDPRLMSWLKPLNAYGWSKHTFDLWLLENELFRQAPAPVVGLKFFNVYGPHEEHKGDMMSVVRKGFDQVLRTGRVKLFRSYRADIADGEQTRDFVYVDDCVSVVLEAFNQSRLRGIFNVGSGVARTWNDCVRGLSRAMITPYKIKYINMPEDLRAQYQYTTCARVERLAASFPGVVFRSLESGIDEYVRSYLMKDDLRSEVHA
jgi:ADP-L-glycero-D-manno-heptose 6-epimerase